MTASIPALSELTWPLSTPLLKKLGDVGQPEWRAKSLPDELLHSNFAAFIWHGSKPPCVATNISPLVRSTTSHV